MDAQVSQAADSTERNGESIEGPLHATVDIDAWSEVYIVGDVHGCINELRALLHRLGPSSDDLVLFVGDLIRKGPASSAVLELVRSRENFRSVRGNNEHRVLHENASTLLPTDGSTYLESLPITISFDDALLVHGGVDPSEPISNQSIPTFLTMRSVESGSGYSGPFWFERYRGPPQIFFGHTVLESPIVRPSAVGLDTGCVYGGELTAYDYYDAEVISVPARRTYQKRRDDRLYSPE